MSGSIAGIDIGNGGFKMAVYKDGEAKLISERLPDNIIVEGRVLAPDTFADFIRTVKRNNHLKVSECALVLPETLTFFRHISMPPMTIEQLELNLPYEFKDFVTADSDTYFYDYAVDDFTYDEDGKPIEMSLFAAAVLKSTIADYTAILRRAGIKLKEALPREMAYAGLFHDYISRNPAAATQEFCLVDIGHDKICIDIYRGSTYVASKVLDIGCVDIDQAIADVRNVDQYVASSYKATNYENVLELPECYVVYNHIAIEVMKVINFYNFSTPGNTLNDIYYCGGGSEIEPLLATIDENVQINTHRIDVLMPQSVASLENISTCAIALSMAMGGRR